MPPPEGWRDWISIFRRWTVCNRDYALKLSQCANPDCLKTGSLKDSLSRCGQCRSVAYCSIECQKKDWPSHKEDCETSKHELSFVNTAIAKHCSKCDEQHCYIKQCTSCLDGFCKKCGAKHLQCHDPVDYEKTIEYSFDVLLIKSTDGIEMLIRNDFAIRFDHMISGLGAVFVTQVDKNRYDQALDCAMAGDQKASIEGEHVGIWPATTYFAVMLALCVHGLYMDHRAEYVVQDVYGNECVFDIINVAVSERTGPDNTQRTMQGLYQMVKPRKAFPAKGCLKYNKTNIGTPVANHIGLHTCRVIRRNLCRISFDNIMKK